MVRPLQVVSTTTWQLTERLSKSTISVGRAHGLCMDKAWTASNRCTVCCSTGSHLIPDGGGELEGSHSVVEADAVALYDPGLIGDDQLGQDLHALHA